MGHPERLGGPRRGPVEVEARSLAAAPSHLELMPAGNGQAQGPAGRDFGGEPNGEALVAARLAAREGPFRLGEETLAQTD